MNEDQTEIERTLPDGRALRYLKREELAREGRFPTRGGARRGSANLLDRVGGGHLQDEHLKRLAEMLMQEEIELLDWFPYGEPNPQVLQGTFRVRPEAAGRLLERLLEWDGLRARKWDVFPYGLPAIDELIIAGEWVAASGP